MGISRYPTILSDCFCGLHPNSRSRFRPEKRTTFNRKDHVKIFEKIGGKMSFFLWGEILSRIIINPY